jgi:hypothetical protein
MASREAGALRPGDVWIDRAKWRGRSFRVRLILESAIPSVVRIIGEDVETGSQHTFEFYRVNRVEIGEPQEVDDEQPEGRRHHGHT